MQNLEQNRADIRMSYHTDIAHSTLNGKLYMNVKW